MSKERSNKLSPQEQQVLSLFKPDDTLTIYEISAILSIQSSRVDTICKQLELRGFLVSNKNIIVDRHWHYSITSKGLTALADILSN